MEIYRVRHNKNNPLRKIKIIKNYYANLAVFQCLLSKKLPITYVNLIQIFCQVTEIWLCEMQK